MRLRFNLLLPVVFVSLLSAAQEKPKAPTSDDLTIKSGVELVQVPVIVRRSGGHVTGLKSEDFTISQDGKQQKIAAFQEVHSQNTLQSKGGPNQFTNYGDNSEVQRITIIAIDTVNTPVLDQANLRLEVIKFLSEAAETGETFGLVALDRNGVHVLHDLTTDPSVLKQTVERLKNTHPAKEEVRADVLKDNVPLNASQNDSPDDLHDFMPAWQGMRDQQERASDFQNRSSRIDTLLVMQQIAQALAGLPGRKTLIWASSGFKFADGLFKTQGGLSRVFTGPSGDSLDQSLHTWELLNAANVAVYPIDARGMVNTAFQFMDTSKKESARYSDKEAARDSSRAVTDSFEEMAMQTGGKPCYGRTDLHNCIREAIEESHDYYILSFYVDKKNTTPGWHKINVKVSQSGKIRFRPGYLYSGINDSAAGKAAALNTDFSLALASPLSYTAVPFQGAFRQLDSGGGRKTVEFELMLPPSSITIDENDKNKMNLDIVAIVRGPGGKEMGKVSQKIERNLPAEGVTVIRAQGIRYKNKLELPPGSYGVWFVLRDNISAHVGSVVTSLKVTP
ncbi:MAG: hypothetical protein JWN45_28 [Acidobacteriaceae bacterium]|nr:hypothetical protein [Acidobacteriaceae bacterium]